MTADRPASTSDDHDRSVDDRVPLARRAARTRSSVTRVDQQVDGPVAARLLGPLLARQPWEDRLIARLRRDPPDTEAMLELYDRTAPWVWSHALHRTRSEAQARQATIAAFLTAAERPEVFEGRISVTVRMLLILHLQTELTAGADQG
jgi:hypothetical protein